MNLYSVVSLYPTAISDDDEVPEAIALTLDLYLVQYKREYILLYRTRVRLIEN